MGYHCPSDHPPLAYSHLLEVPLSSVWEFSDDTYRRWTEEILGYERDWMRSQIRGAPPPSESEIHNSVGATITPSGPEASTSMSKQQQKGQQKGQREHFQPIHDADPMIKAELQDDDITDYNVVESVRHGVEGLGLDEKVAAITGNTTRNVQRGHHNDQVQQKQQQQQQQQHQQQQTNDQQYEHIKREDGVQDGDGLKQVEDYDGCLGCEDIDGDDSALWELNCGMSFLFTLLPGSIVHFLSFHLLRTFPFQVPQYLNKP